MKKRIALLAFCAAMVFVLAGCDFITSLFWPKVTLADAKEAWTAFGSSFGAAMSTCTVDNGSTSSAQKYKNAAGTLSYETPVSSAYPSISIFTFTGYSESASLYKLSGTLTMNVTSVSTATMAFDIDMDHASKPVKKIAGTVPISPAPTDTLKFNNEEFTIADLNSP
jgi:hypothetical protein